MTPIPPEVAARWKPMWSPDAHVERPWWRLGTQAWVRADGAEVGTYTIGEGRFYRRTQEAVNAALAEHDAAHPLPAPGPMPGQVWVYPDGREEMIPTIFGVYGQDGRERATLLGGHPGPKFNGESWPPPGAILIAGPTPWGRDVPWSGA